MLQKPSNNVCQIVTDGCCVELGNEVVLDDVTFSIKEGTLVGVVGPNGGGKTTLFNTILGLVPITHGSMKIKGLNPNEATGMVGYVPQREEFNWKFYVTARQVVQMGITKNSSFLSITSKIPSKVPPHINKILVVSIFTSGCSGCFLPPCGGMLAIVPSIIFNNDCWTPSPDTSLVIDILEPFLAILSISSI